MRLSIRVPYWTSLESHEAVQMARLLGSRAIETVYIWDLSPTESLSNSSSISCCAYNHYSILVISSLPICE